MVEPAHSLSLFRGPCEAGFRPSSGEPTQLPDQPFFATALPEAKLE